MRISVALARMKLILRQMFTESDNQTYDLYRFISCITIFTGLFLSVLSVVNGQEWKFQDFGFGAGSILAGMGVAHGLKKETPILSPLKDK